MKTPISRTQIAQWIVSVPHHIQAGNHNTLVDIGNQLTVELVTGCKGINSLVDMWANHGYRPTIRASEGPEYKLLADIYDFVAKSRRLDVVAYRGK
jgi:hypothetical protein